MQRLVDHQLDRSIVYLTRRAATWPITQSRQALAREARAPFADCLCGNFQFASDLPLRPPRKARQHHTGTEAQRARSVFALGPLFELRYFLSTQA